MKYIILIAFLHIYSWVADGAVAGSVNGLDDGSVTRDLAELRIDVKEPFTRTDSPKFLDVHFVVKNKSIKVLDVTGACETTVSLFVIDDHGSKTQVWFPPGVEAMLIHTYSILATPGGSKLFACRMSLRTLKEAKGKQLIASVRVLLEDRAEHQLYSDVFKLPPIPSELDESWWVDLGEQNYLEVIPDLSKLWLWGQGVPDSWVMSKPEYQTIRESIWAENLSIPVKIVNISKLDCIAAVDSVRFYVVRATAERMPPVPLKTMRASKPVLKPADSTFASGWSYIRIEDLESQGYKPGDKVVAAVGGRIVNTNKLFECYSAPFGLPLLPPSHPPKGERDKGQRVTPIH